MTEQFKDLFSPIKLGPVIGIIIGLAFLVESMAPVQIAGTIVVLLGVVLAQRR